MKTKICVILIAAFVALFGTSVYFIFDHYRQEEQQAELYDSLADIVDCPFLLVQFTRRRAFPFPQIFPPAY